VSHESMTATESPTPSRCALTLWWNQLADGARKVRVRRATGCHASSGVVKPQLRSLATLWVD
jgi:hypothetical protein